MREDLVYGVTNEEVDALLTQGYDVEMFDGALIDNYVIYGEGGLSYDGEERKYFLVEEKFVNEWTSRYELTMTDDTRVLDAFVDKYLVVEED